MAEKSYRPSTSQLLRTSFALDRRTAEMVQQLRKQHAAISVTDYIKGLIALDWLETKRTPLDVTQVPAWIIVAYKLDVTQGKVQPRSYPKTDI
jgi:hypothetical protein